MNKKEKRMVCDRIENEGLEYAIRCYSSFDNIKDPEFHRIRLAFIKAAKDLEDYVGFPKYRGLGEDSDDDY